MGNDITEFADDWFVLRSRETEFHRNIYIRRFRRDGQQVNLVLDAGTRADVPALTEVLGEVAGGLSNLHLIFLSHQDPDVTGNTPFLLANAPGAFVVASEDTWRLIKMLGVPASRFIPLSEAQLPLRLKRTGHFLYPVSARYCHFRGAMMLYDPERRVLFSGDFLGGVNTRAGAGVYADEASWDGIALFHQIYMPSSRAVRAVVDRVTALDPFPEIIAPQHGDVIPAPLVVEFLTRLAELPVGVDVAAPEEKPYAAKVLEVLGDVLDYLGRLRPGLAAKVAARLTSSSELTPVFVFTHGRLTGMKVSPEVAAETLWRELAAAAGPEELSAARLAFTAAFEKANLPLPDVLLQSGEGIYELVS